MGGSIDYARMPTTQLRVYLASRMERMDLLMQGVYPRADRDICWEQIYRSWKELQMRGYQLEWDLGRE